MTPRIVEVGPRDGLQNEKVPVPTDAKLRFIDSLLKAGLREIEVTSFVSPKWVPQLGDAADLWPLLPPGGTYSALVPNVKGWERAQSVGVKRIALFTAASDEFTRKNINMTIDESLEVFREVMDQAAGTYVRGYVSTAFECPYAGKIAPVKVLEVANRLLALGVDEISLGDTIGVASPKEVHELAKVFKEGFAGNASQVLWHFHDTFGRAIANVAEVLEWDVFGGFDSSAAGLGGCPYAPGAAGNLATDDLVDFLERQGIPTGIDRVALAQSSLPILEALGRAPQAKAQVARLGLLR